MEKEVIALDAQIVKDSVRRRDANGYLHVETSRLTADQVAPYYGRDIPNARENGLDLDRIYYAWRAPEELNRALSSFNGVPLLIKHKFDSAENPNTDLRVGTVGTSAKWEPPFITNALSVWNEEAIQAIEDGSLRDLSCGYRYVPDFTPGKTPDGVEYDFVMRDIKCNHVALVADGRAKGCYVEDQLPEEMKNMTEENKVEDNDTTEGEGATDNADAIKNILAEAGIQLDPEKLDALAQAILAAMSTGDNDVAEDNDEGASDNDEGASDNDGEGASDEDGETSDSDEGAQDEEGEASDSDEPSEGAQDAALIAKTVKRELRALYSAADAVKGTVGAVNPLAYDSADAIYLDALKQMKYPRKVKASEAKAVFYALQSVKSLGAQGAMDSNIKPKREGNASAFLSKFLK